jgi:predicted dehydrogenase
LKELGSHIKYFHIKDFDENKNYVPLGKGIINYKRIISDIKDLFPDEKIFLSLETHVRPNTKEATIQSFEAIKNLLSRKRIRYGIIGCGKVFAKNVSAVSKNEAGELRTIFDIDRKKALKAASNFDCEAKVTIEEFLEDPMIDVVNIRTPNDTHTELVLESLKNGKFCLCEKPLCLTKKEGEKIIKNKFYKKNVAVNFQNRFNPAIQKLFEYLDEGKLGKIIFCSVDVRWWRDDAYFKDWHGDIKRVGGMLFNQGAHAVDLLLKICGPAKNITKIVKPLRKSSKLDDIYLALIEFKNGAIGKLEITSYTKYKNCEAAIFIIGEKGSVKIGGPSFNKIEFLSSKTASEINSDDGQQTNESSHFRLIKALNDYLIDKKINKNIVFAEDGAEVTKFIEKLYCK